MIGAGNPNIIHRMVTQEVATTSLREEVTDLVTEEEVMSPNSVVIHSLQVETLCMEEQVEEDILLRTTCTEATLQLQEWEDLLQTSMECHLKMHTRTLHQCQWVLSTICPLQTNTACLTTQEARTNSTNHLKASASLPFKAEDSMATHLTTALLSHPSTLNTVDHQPNHSTDKTTTAHHQQTTTEAMELSPTFKSH